MIPHNRNNCAAVFLFIMAFIRSSKSNLYIELLLFIHIISCTIYDICCSAFAPLPFKVLIRHQVVVPVVSTTVKSSSSSKSSTSNSNSPIKNNDIDVNLSNYDFSSKQGWDEFYQQATTTTNKEDHQEKEEENIKLITPFEFEWHNSLDISSILTSLPQLPSKDDSVINNMLLVGNGNSNLPQIIYDHYDGDNKMKIVGLDYSQPCIDMLRTVYDKEQYPNMDFICGDATKLVLCIKSYYTNTFQSETEEMEAIDDKFLFDVIIDKGLMDAIMCDEGWNTSVEKYIRGVSELLKKNESSQFMLISYKLNPSTKDFLLEMGDKFGLRWDFDIVDKSNGRVSFSIGRKIVS